MKAYMKPEIAAVELFTKDAISLKVPKTVYKRTVGGEKFTVDNDLLAMALMDGESLSVAALN